MKTRFERCFQHQLSHRASLFLAALLGADCGGGSDLVPQLTLSADGRGPGPLFMASNPWNEDISALPAHESSAAITGWLGAHGGWGGGHMELEFGINVLTADESTPFRSFVPTDQFFTPDCDFAPIPVPAIGALEGEVGYECAHGGDCHLLVVHQPSRTLYETWRANIAPDGTFTAGCTAVWELDRIYPPNLRGDGCSSADGGGFPIAALMFSADEVAAGEIRHAIRFVLPNERIRQNLYVHPGTHSTWATAGDSIAPPYGVRFRLRSDFPLRRLSPGARVIARAMQRYGMFLADGGTIALTAQNDRFTTHKWSEVGIWHGSLREIQPTDMEVVAMGDPVLYSGVCTRNP